MRVRKLLLLAPLALPVFAFGQTVTAESAIVMDSASGKVLWSRNANEELYPASTTKIMTSLLLLEHCKPDDVILAPMDVDKVKESSMHLKPGERVKAKDMLYALMLRSANDGCYAVAVHIAGSVDKFSDMMNARAKEIGCTHTHFHNPNGLNDPLHYTTAHDLALIGRAAMEYPAFRDIVHTEKTKINRGTNWKDLWMTNHNRILKRDPTCDGIKTGWTIPAGHCFVGSATRNDWRVITVVMKSKSWENDTEDLFNWAYATFDKHPEVKPGDVCGTVNVSGGALPTENVVATQAVYTLQRKGTTAVSNRTLQVPSPVAAPIADKAPLGTLEIQDADGFKQTVPVQASGVVPQTPAAKITNPGNKGIFVLASLLVGMIYVRGRSRKRLSRLFS